MPARGWRAAPNIAVADLAHGEKKQLELLMAFALRPKLLLLDEPMAGLGHLESQEMIATLRDIARRCGDAVG